MTEFYPAYPLYRADNRKMKRAMTHEFNRLTLKTAEVEALFGSAVFWDAPNMTYDDFYKTYLGLYIEKLDYINRKLKPKYITLNPEYFKQMYAPEEDMITPVPWVSHVSEIVRQWLWHVEVNLEND